MTATSAGSATPRIDAKIDQTLSELDQDKARALANQVDTMIWQEGFNLPLFQSPGDIAVRRDLANYGAPDWPTWTTRQIGFTRTDPRATAVTAGRVGRARSRDGGVDRLPQQAQCGARRQRIQRRRPVGKPVEFAAAYRRAMARAAGSRKSSAPCAMVGSSAAPRWAPATHPLGHRRRCDQIAATGDHHGGPAEIRHLGHQVVRLSLESELQRLSSRIATAGSSGRPSGSAA